VKSSVLKSDKSSNRLIPDFPGELRTLKIERLVDSKEEDNIEMFFLVLGLFYNDLKSFLFYLRPVREKLKALREGQGAKLEPNVDIGEYGGMETHLFRLIAATVYTFLEFLKGQGETLDSIKFGYIYDKLNRENKGRWDLIIGIAQGEDITEAEEFIKILVRLRNNIAFHYSEKELRAGYLDWFGSASEDRINDFAYYSLGSNMLKTRFFYSDAAVLGAFQSIAKTRMDFTLFMDGLSEFIEETNIVVLHLMKNHIGQLPSK